MNKLTIPLVIFFIGLATYISRNGTKAANTTFESPVPIEISRESRKELERTNIKNHSNYKTFDEALIASLAMEDDEEVIHALKAGANPNIIFNNRKFTMAMDKSLNCNPKILMALIEAGADLNMKDTHNNSALDYAKRNGNEECINILIDSGAK